MNETTKLKLVNRRVFHMGKAIKIALSFKYIYI